MEDLNRTKYQKRGLSSSEVREKREKGQVNGELRAKTKSYRQIIWENLFTLFNLIQVLLLICILLSGSLKNGIFFLIVIWNFGIGTFQEIKAKKTLEHLSLLSDPKVCVLRDGKLQEIEVKDLVLSDWMLLKAGNQICADAVVTEGRCEVNESLLTGESIPIQKKDGDTLLSGSFLVSGQVFAQTIHVGKENYVQQITSQAAAKIRPVSILMKSVKSIVRIVVLCMIPLAGLLVWNNFFRIDQDFSTAMIKTVATVSSMIPGGLVLLVSVVLAVSVVRLSARNTMVQDLYCVENLARVDTLLLDKTGTITEGSLQVEQVVSLLPEDSLEAAFEKKQSILSLLTWYLSHSPDDNITSRALRTYCGPDSNAPSFPSDDTIPFSSERKWGMVKGPGNCNLYLGAPDVILGSRYSSVREITDNFTRMAKRVVLLAFSEPSRNSDPAPVALLVLADRVRSTASDTFRFFAGEGVSIHVISGDDPRTVSAIAKEAGLRDAEHWIDASLLKDDADLREAADTYTVFGRVSPEQKQKIVRFLKEAGHTVAMTGDGANDVLALREADCSIAMQSGSDAAREISDLVLLNSDFSSLPLVLAEGRKSINNLQRSASLYLTKTTYSILFAVFFILQTKMAYPFENIQVTLIGAVTIGIPSFFLALEPNYERIRSHFLWNVFKTAIPSGILQAVSMLVLCGFLQYRQGASPAEISTACVYLLLLTGILVIFGICGKWNTWKIALLIGLIVIAGGAVLLFPELFSLTVIPRSAWRTLLIIAAGFWIVHALTLRILLPKLEAFLERQKTRKK